MVRAADYRSASPWFESGCALDFLLASSLFSLCNPFGVAFSRKVCWLPASVPYPVLLNPPPSPFGQNNARNARLHEDERNPVSDWVARRRACMLHRDAAEKSAAQVRCGTAHRIVARHRVGASGNASHRILCRSLAESVGSKGAKSPRPSGVIFAESANLLARWVQSL